MTVSQKDRQMDKRDRATELTIGKAAMIDVLRMDGLKNGRIRRQPTDHRRWGLCVGREGNQAGGALIPIAIGPFASVSDQGVNFCTILVERKAMVYTVRPNTTPHNHIF